MQLVEAHRFSATYLLKKYTPTLWGYAAFKIQQKEKKAPSSVFIS